MPLISLKLCGIPPLNWIKCNCDTAYLCNSLPADSYGIFRTNYGNFMLAFADKVEWSFSYLVEFSVVVSTMKIAIDIGWCQFWIKTDSINIVQAFQNPSLMYWQTRNHWFSCLNSSTHKHLFISHIYREGNTCANFLVNVRLNCNFFPIFDSIPSNIRKDFVQNRLGMSSFRFFFF